MGAAGRDDRPAVTLKKHSLTIAGHPTSISLEEPFWRELNRLARENGKSLAGLVSEIDGTRSGNLSSALRIFVLQKLKDEAAPAVAPPQARDTS